MKSLYSREHFFLIIFQIFRVDIIIMNFGSDFFKDQWYQTATETSSISITREKTCELYEAHTPFFCALHGINLILTNFGKLLLRSCLVHNAEVERAKCINQSLIFATVTSGKKEHELHKSFHFRKKTNKTYMKVQIKWIGMKYLFVKTNYRVHCIFR